MSDSLQPALDRLRNAVASGINYSEIYGYGPEHELAVLASAYLIEHPEDDGETVTREWLTSVGFTAYDENERDPSKWLYFISPKSKESKGRSGPIVHLRIDPLYGCDGWSIVEAGDEHTGLDSVQIPSCETRGDVRRLCAALSIPLKE
jgi:hypothetical protein